MRFLTIFLILFVLLLIAILGNCGGGRKDSIRDRSEVSSTRSDPLDEALESAEKKFKSVLGNLRNKTVKTAKSLVRSVSEFVKGSKRDFLRNLLISLKGLRAKETVWESELSHLVQSKKDLINNYSESIKFINYANRKLKKMIKQLKTLKVGIIEKIKENFFSESIVIDETIINQISKDIDQYGHAEMINFEEIRKIHISAENHCFVITSNFQKILDENNTIQSKYQNLYNEEYLNYLKLLTDGNISVEMKAPDNIFNYIYNIGEKDFCKKEEEFNDDVDTLPNRRKASGVKKVRKTSWGQRHSSFNRELKKEIENELNYLNENMDILWEKIARKIIYLQYFYQDLIRAILLCERIEKHHQKHEKTSLGIGTSAGQPSPKTSKEYDSLMIKLNHLKVKPVMMYFIISHRKGFPSDHSGVALAEILRKEKDKLYKTANYASFMELYGITTYEGVYHYEGPEFYNNQLKVYFNFIFGSYKPKFVQVEVKRKNKIEISESATGASSNIVSGRESRRSSGHIKFEPSSQSSEKHSEIHSETDEEKIEVEKDEEDYSDFDGDDSNEEYDDQGQKQVQQIGQSGVPPFYQQPSQYYNPQDIPGSSTGYYHYPPDFQH